MSVKKQKVRQNDIHIGKDEMEGGVRLTSLNKKDSVRLFTSQMKVESETEVVFGYCKHHETDPNELIPIGARKHDQIISKQHTYFHEYLFLSESIKNKKATVL